MWPRPSQVGGPGLADLSAGAGEKRARAGLVDLVLRREEHIKHFLLKQL